MIASRAAAAMTKLLATYTAAEFAVVEDFLAKTTELLATEASRLQAKSRERGSA
jgi:predicted component of type VI protein secretion system